MRIRRRKNDGPVGETGPDGEGTPTCESALPLVSYWMPHSGSLGSHFTLILPSSFLPPSDLPPCFTLSRRFLRESRFASISRCLAARSASAALRSSSVLAASIFSVAASFLDELVDVGLGGGDVLLELGDPLLGSR